MANWTQDQPCPKSPDGKHVWEAPSTEMVEIAPGVERGELVRVCASCGRTESYP